MFIQSFFESLLYYISEIRIAPNVSIGDIVSFSALILAYVQFKKQIAIARDDREKKQRAEWYLNVIVMPHLRGIDNFYYDLIEDVKSRCEAMKGLCINRVRDQDLAVELADNKNQNRMLITAFFDELEPLIRSYDNEMGERIAALVMTLQDLCSDIISQYNQDNVVKEIKMKLLYHKQNVLSVMGEVMSINNNNLK